MHCWRFVSSIVLGHLPRAEAESHRLYSAPRPLSSSTSFSSLHITKGNLQPLAEGEFCNGTSFCLRQEPVSSVASTMRWQVAPMESYLPILCMCTNVRLYFRQVSSTYMSNPVLDVHHVLPYQPEICLPRWHRLTAFAWLP